MGLPSSVSAGAVYDSPLVITSTYARGSLRTVRESADTYESIGCRVTGPYDYVLCIASNRTRTLSCFENRDEFLGNIRETIASMTSDSALMFRVGADGRCRSIEVTNNSYYR